MSSPSWLDIRPEVATALAERRPVVALESSLIAQGLPWPQNLETAQAAEDAVRQEGATPATIAVLRGRPSVGLSEEELEVLSHAQGVDKVSRRDLAAVGVAGRTAATTVAATMTLAHHAGIRVFATGGIGGAHRGPDSWDISADLFELARTPVAVVCAGAKSILDIARTLEILESYGVPVLGYRTRFFPEFFVQSDSEPLAHLVDSPRQAAEVLNAHWQMGGAGVVLAQALPVSEGLVPAEFQAALTEAERKAHEAKIRGPALTPYLLARLAEITGGQTLRANRALVIANARLAAQVATALCQLRHESV